MDRHYDIFEVMPDGTTVWKSAAAGHELAIIQMKALASKTKNEIRVMHLPTNSVVATLKRRS
jgi:hypothetical protein